MDRDRDRDRDEDEEDGIVRITSHLLQVKPPNDYEGAKTDHSNNIDGAGAVPRPGDSSITAILAFSDFIAVCGSFAYGCAAGYTSPVEREIMSDLSLSTAEFSLFGSMLTVGGFIGSIVSGKLSDYIGRKGAMAISDTFSLAGWVSIVLSQGAWSLDLGRFLQGVSVGILMFTVPVYIAEITPRNLRGGSVLINQLMICLGISTMFFAGTVIQWRILGLIGIIPLLVQLLGLFFIPESPRYLAKIGKDEECEAALQRLRGDAVDISLEATDIEEYTEALKQIPEGNFFTLFQRQYKYALTVVLGLMIFGQFGGNTGILFYASEIFESAGCSTSIGSVAMAIIQLPSSAAGVFAMDKSGRRPVAMVSAAGMCFSCIVTALSFVLRENQWSRIASPYLVLIGILGYSVAYTLGIGGIPFLMMSEILPMNIKGLAGGLASAVNWFSSWIVSYTFNFFLEWSSSGTFFLLAGINGLLVLFIAKLVPETKGRTLEEIQESVTHISQENTHTAS
ncbi:hypothetical protein Dimus_012231 [Dionaea muscipula]